jgi:2',3'-cyclic-nucleotide 2'-phosphodiesterase/3'-nucleotidase
MKSNPQRIGFKNFLFNFDSALGIKYEVDVTKPAGEKVTIHCMADGKPFDLFQTYKVAMTAYRANGGGELLTKGAGLSKEEIDNRIIGHTERDIRHYLMEYIKKKKDIFPHADNHWRFIPTEWVEKATKKEKEILFGQHLKS